MKATRSPLRDPTPLPLRVYRELRAEFTAGAHPPGSKLPSEAELASSFGVSRVTVREALRMLQRDGLVAARHGRGHFVLDRAPIREPITELRGVTELLASLGYEVETQVLDVRHVSAGDFAESLCLPSDEPIVRVARLRSSLGEPLIYSIDIVPMQLLGDGEIDFAGSLVDALARRGFDLAYAHARIRAASLPRGVRRWVGIGAPAAWLLLDQVNYGVDDTPLMVSHDYHRGDRFEFNVMRRRLE